MAALTVHLDDSGTHPEAPVAVCAGWIAPVKNWIRFTRDWDKAKQEFGFEMFHSAECMSDTPPSSSDFYAWTPARKKAAYLRLASIAQEHAAHGFAIAVIKADYDEIVPPAVRDRIGKYHYTAAVRAILAFIDKWGKFTGGDNNIEYIFDTMTKGAAKNEIDLVFEQTALMYEKGIPGGIPAGRHSFRNKREIMPLQAADLLAWSTAQAYGSNLTRKNILPYVAHKVNRWKRHNVEAAYSTRDQLREFALKDPQLLVDVPLDWNQNSGRARRAKSMRTTRPRGASGILLPSKSW